MDNRRRTLNDIISTIFLLNVGTVPTAWYIFFHFIICYEKNLFILIFNLFLRNCKTKCFILRYQGLSSSLNPHLGIFFFIDLWWLSVKIFGFIVCYDIDNVHIEVISIQKLINIDCRKLVKIFVLTLKK
jgi:hypothetical protein